MCAKQKKQKSASVSQPASNISLVLPYFGEAEHASQWLKSIQDFSANWKGKVDLTFLDVSTDNSLQAVLEENNSLEELKSLYHVSILESDTLGEGLQKATGNARGEHLITWEGNRGVKLSAVKEWAAKYKNDLPDDRILTARRDLGEKATKKAVKANDGSGAIRFRGFTTQRINDPGAPLKVYPLPLAEYLFAKIPPGSTLFEAEVLHWAEEEIVEIEELPVNYNADQHLKKPVRSTAGTALGRALAFKWHYQVREPIRQIAKKGEPERPEFLGSPQYLTRVVFTVLLIFLFIGMPLLSFDYGATGDENLQDNYGQKLVDYYTSFGEDKSALNYKNLYLYGGLFETIASGAADIFDPMIEGNYRYEIRHIFNSLFGFLAILFTGLLGKYLWGWRGGLLAVLMLVLSPRFFGHTMNNPKDIPFAAFYIMGIYFMVKLIKEFPNPAKKTLIWLIVAIACSISVRIGGLLLIAYLGLFLLVELGRQFYVKKIPNNERGNLFQNAVKYGLIIVAIGYFGGLIFWPYGHQNPLVNPFNALQHMSDFPVTISTLFEGKMIASSNVPGDYIFQFLLYTSPVVVIAGFVLFVLGIPSFRQYPEAYFYWIVFFAAAFPVGYIIYKGSNLYDGMRQVLFVYPPLVVLGTCAYNHVNEKLQNRSYRIAGLVVLAGLMVLPLSFMVRNHPNQYVYYNEILGGIEEAYGEYELDYWANSTKQAADWLGEHITEKNPLDSTVRVKSNFTHNTRAVIQRYSDSFHVSYVKFRERSQKNYDYAVFILRFIPVNILENYWPPKGTVHQVKVDGTPIATIVKRNNYHDLKGHEHLNNKEYQQAISHFEKYRQYDPTNEDVLFALGRCYMRTRQVNNAQQVVEKGLKIYPGNAMGYLQLAQIHLQKRQPRAAIQNLRRLRQINPRLFQRARRLYQQAQQMLRQR